MILTSFLQLGIMDREKPVELFDIQKSFKQKIQAHTNGEG